MSKQNSFLSKLWLCLLCVFLYSDATFAKAPLNLKPYTATYNVYWKSIKVGTSSHLLYKQADNTYIAEARAKPFAAFLPFSYYEKSKFKMTGHKIHPKEYSFQNEEKGEQETGTLVFNWPAKQVINSLDPKYNLYNITSSTQDRLSHLFQMRADLHALKLRKFSYAIAKPDELSIYSFEVIDTEQLSTNIGTLNTIKVINVKKGSDRTTIIWLCPDMDYMLIKLQQYRNNKRTAEIVIDSLKYT